MGYMYEPPSMLGNHKQNRIINKALRYEGYNDFLLKMLPAIDVESGEIISSRIYKIWIRRNRVDVQYDDYSTKSFELTLDELLERTIPTQENNIPYCIELEYSRDEDFRNFIIENYPSFADKIDAQAKNNNKSETYNLFYQYFISDHSREPRSICMITDKQLLFQTTKRDISDRDSIEFYDEQHYDLTKRYTKQTKTEGQKDEHVFIFGVPSFYEPEETVLFPESGLSLSQYMFLLDYVNAYKDVTKELNESSRKKLQKKYQKHIDEIQEELDKSLQSGFAVREPNINEVIIGKIRTEDEIKRQMSYEEISRKMRKLQIKDLWWKVSKAKAFSTDNGEFDYESFYKRYMNNAYKAVQKRQNELKSYKSQADEGVTAIDMYLKGQEIKDRIDELEEEVKIKDGAIRIVQRQSGLLLPSIYYKQNIIRRMISNAIRLLRRKEVAEVERRINYIKAEKKEIEDEIKKYTRQYINMNIPKENEEQFRSMTSRDLDTKKNALMQESNNRKIELEETQKLLELIIGTGVLEKDINYQVVV